jgi:hypothetical protein
MPPEYVLRMRPPASESSKRSCLGVRAAEPAQSPDHHEVLHAGEHLVERGVLSRHPDAALHRSGLGHHVVACHACCTCVGMGEGGEDANGRALAGSVRPEHAENRARRHFEVEPVERNRRAVPLDEAVGLDHQISHFPGVSLPVGKLGM